MYLPIINYILYNSKCLIGYNLKWDGCTIYYIIMNCTFGIE